MINLVPKTKIFRGLQTGWLENHKDGKPVVFFLHGFPDSPEAWEKQFDYFDDKFQIVAPYTRGAGPSKKAGASKLRRYGTDAAVLDALEILDAVDGGGSRPVLLVGHDLGAVHALKLASALGQRCKGVVIINGLGIKQMGRRLMGGGLRHLKKAWYMFAMQVPHLPEFLMQRFSGQILRRAYQAGGRSQHEKTDSEMLVGPLNQYRAFLRELPRELIRNTPRLFAPLLVLWGRDDAFLEPPTQDEMETIANRVTIRILRGNHWVHRESSVVVNELINDFFKKCVEEKK